MRPSLMAGGAALAGLLVGGCGGGGTRQSERIDLGPRAGWRASGVVRARDDGRLWLAADGSGFVWKVVTLDVDRYPVLLVRTAQSLPRFRWTVAVQRGDRPPLEERQAIPLLTKIGEEGGYVVPLARLTGWHGVAEFVLLIALEGRERDWVEFADLEAVRLTDDLPPAPRLTDPANASTINSLALHYSWHQAKNALAYDLQVSSAPTFSPAQTTRVTAPYLADRLPYLPEPSELLRPGRWYWRVRSVNLVDQAGAWSPAQWFTVTEPTAPKPPQVAPSPRRPLIVLAGDGHRLAENWRGVPAELKPYTVLRIEALPAETLEVLVRAAEREGIPLVVQVSGPHDYYGPVASRIPLPVVERLLGHSVVKGIYLCEQAFRVSPVNDPIMRHYAARLIPLAAGYGKLVLWADGHWGRNLFIDVGLDPELLRTVRAYRAYVVPIWKMNGALTPYSAHDAVLGLWASGAVDAWGVQPESWYWYEAGFRQRGQRFWFKEGDASDFPPTFYGEMALLGLSGGASVYSFEPGGDVFGTGGPSQVAQQVIFPLLSQVIQRGLVPDRSEVLTRIRSVYVLTHPDLRWSLDYGTLATLYQAAYGNGDPFRIIPANSRYFWIPLLPEGTPKAVLATFPDRIQTAQFSSAADAKAYLNRRYPPKDGGEAWTAELGGLGLVLHAAENQGVDQRFSVRLQGPVSRLAGRISVNGYLVARADGSSLWIQVNGQAGRKQELTLYAGRRPREVIASRRGALLSQRWAPPGQGTIELALDGSALEVRVVF